MHGPSQREAFGRNATHGGGTDDRGDRRPGLPLCACASITMAQKEPMPPPKHLHIRDAVDADGPSLALLIARVFAEYAGVRFLAEEFPELEAPASHYASRAGRLMVGEDDGRDPRLLCLVPTHEPASAEFLKVYVDRSLRGQGVARRLLDLASAEARAARRDGDLAVVRSEVRRGSSLLSA